MRGRQNYLYQLVVNCIRYVTIIRMFRLRESIRCEQTGSILQETISDPVNSCVGSIEVIGGLSRGTATTF